MEAVLEVSESTANRTPAVPNGFIDEKGRSNTVVVATDNDHLAGVLLAIGLV